MELARKGFVNLPVVDRIRERSPAIHQCPPRRISSTDLGLINGRILRRRWLRDREDTPWYPSMRLFRQRAPQAWAEVIARVCAELARVASGAPGAAIDR
jgi:hypothetical protein